LKRISLGVELLQTFISEAIYKTYHVRKTFTLQLDLPNQDNTSYACESFWSRLELKNALNMTASQLFISLAEELKESKQYDSDCKYLLMLSFTRYEPELIANEKHFYSSTKGYCALGK